jgi:hypothetical protein
MSFRFLRRRPAAARRAALGLALGLLAALASCGGGGLVEPFRPTRILALGDELSVIEADGRKYTVNAFKVTDSTTTPQTESTTELDCVRNPIWIRWRPASAWPSTAAWAPPRRRPARCWHRQEARWPTWAISSRP